MKVTRVNMAIYQENLVEIPQLREGLKKGRSVFSNIGAEGGLLSDCISVNSFPIKILDAPCLSQPEPNPNSLKDELDIEVVKKKPHHQKLKL